MISLSPNLVAIFVDFPDPGKPIHLSAFLILILHFSTSFTFLIELKNLSTLEPIDC